MMSRSLLVVLASNHILAGVCFGRLRVPDRGPHGGIFSECSLQF